MELRASSNKNLIQYRNHIYFGVLLTIFKMQSIIKDSLNIEYHLYFMLFTKFHRFEII